jgi:hypothetical protein
MTKARYKILLPMYTWTYYFRHAKVYIHMPPGYL